ncbi:MAG: PDZ domain-containing protein [Candidatus Electryoneaceae bacterium]|nr:PDZ domain-containing protein [Candidatus Electryoneaceae bacterium]
MKGGSYFYRNVTVGILALFLILMGTGISHAEERQTDEPSPSFLGVYVGDLNDETRQALSYSGTGGILISALVDGGVAEAAGLHAKDILIKMNDQEIGSLSDLHDFLTLHPAGETVTATVIRSGDEQELQVVLGDRKKKMKKKLPAFLGVYPDDLDDDDREEFDYSGTGGILIDGIVEGGPAEAAGMQSEDILISINDQAIETVDELHDFLATNPAGETVRVIVVRGGNEEGLDVVLGTRKIELSAPKIWNWNWESLGNLAQLYGRGFLGVETITLDGDLAEYFDVEDGALIKNVVEDSPADQAGLKTGDVIVKIGDEDITSSDDVFQAIRSHEPEEEVTVKVIRKGRRKSKTVTLGEVPNPMEGISIDHEGLIHIQESVREALEGMEIHLQGAGEELREELYRLREEMEEIREEMREDQDENNGDDEDD